MESKFVNLLNLSEELKKKISLFEVRKILYGEDLYFKIFFEVNGKLELNDVVELIRKIELFTKERARYNRIKIKESDIIMINNDGISKEYELYEYIRYLIENFASTNHKKYYVEFDEEGNAMVITSTDLTRVKLQKALPGIKMFLNNFGIYKKNIKIIHDASKFDYDKIEVKKNKKINKIIKQEEKIPPRSGYKLILPSNLSDDMEKAYFEGIVFFKENRVTKNGWKIQEIKIAKDYEALSIISFIKKGDKKEYPDISKGDYIRVYGNIKWNSFSKEYNMNYIFHEQLKKEFFEDKEIDHTDEKRAEIRIHSKMSQMDGVGAIDEYISRAKELGFKGIVITDKNSVQSFPNASKKYNENFKIGFGLDLDTYDDIRTNIVENCRKQNLKNSEYVFFDLETTGISPLNDEIIEFGGVRIQNNNIIEKKQFFIKPTISIPKRITEITNITDDDVANGKNINEALKEIIDFMGESILVAHNAEFDMTFLNSFLRRNGYKELENTVIDTLKVSRFLYKNLRNHRLGTIARSFDKSFGYEDTLAHRADYDAKVLSEVYENMLHDLHNKENIYTTEELNKKSSETWEKVFETPVTIIAKNQNGLKKLYKIVSDANTKYFNKIRKTPSYPLSKLLENREDLILGSGDYRGLAFKAATQDWSNIDEIVKLFDYIEFFPISAYGGEISKGFYTRDGIRNVIRKLEEVSIRNNIPLIASADPYYNKKNDKLLRDVYISAKGLGGKLHYLHNYNNPNYIKPDQHMRTTAEMISSVERIFNDKEKAKKYVVENSVDLINSLEVVEPLKDELFTPKLPEGEEDFLKLVKENTIKLYGEEPHKEIKDRIDKEINSITKHGFAVIYYLSSVAVRKSIDDGYLVGSRGSVGSSIAATLSDITEVNPLKPHYRCPKCKYVEFVNSVSSGYDLEDKECPKCNSVMLGDGHDIPFETFLGFEGDKVPDIDLNFSGEYQSKIHSFMGEILGRNNIFRAGTISTVAQKTAFGYIKGFYESRNEEPPSKTRTEWIASRVEGTKRTTGQHPGGLIVVPNHLEIEDFTPINYPGNDYEAEWLTTHFDFHSIHDNLLKLDFLGHVDPSAIKMLEDLTGVNSKRDIPMNSKEVLSLFENDSSLKIKERYLKDEKLGILGIPEFGTKFVRELVKDAKPESFADLIRISGLSHGTDVWIGNAKEIIEKGLAKLKDVISVRDDIMTYLINHGVDHKISFNIMESVRKGKGLTPEWEEIMRVNGVADWYIDSCKKIKYMFPKAHATAYVIMAFRIAWYKINYPLAYYATFFTKRDTEWDLDVLYKSPKEMLEYINNIESKSKWESSDRERNIASTLYIVLELLSRGYKIANISMEISKGVEWVIDEKNNSIIPPFNIIEGLGDSVGIKLEKARDEKMFTSIEDFDSRSGVNVSLKEKFSKLKLLDNFEKEESNQLDIFEW